MLKFIALGATSLLGVGLGALLSAAPPPPTDGPPPPPHEKKKGGPGPRGPEGELRKAYDLLRRLRAADGPAGKPQERLKDWTERASRLYRKAVEAKAAGGPPHKAHEYASAAHALARAIGHARDASRVDRPDPELPPPPPGRGPDDDAERTTRELRHAYDRIREGRDRESGPEARFYFDAARDLYNAARKDAEGDRPERAGELARAAEAMTHVPEHLARAIEDHPEPKQKHEPKAKPKDRPEPKDKDDRPEGERPRAGRDLPPPLD